MNPERGSEPGPQLESAGQMFANVLHWMHAARQKPHSAPLTKQTDTAPQPYDPSKTDLEQATSPADPYQLNT